MNKYTTKCQTCFDINKEMQNDNLITMWETKTENQATQIKWIHLTNNSLHNVFVESV